MYTLQCVFREVANCPEYAKLLEFMNVSLCLMENNMALETNMGEKTLLVRPTV